MISIRNRLFLILLAATGVIWLSAFLWVQHSTRTEVERVLDARLAEAARMVASLVASRHVDVATAIAAAADRVDGPDGAQADASGFVTGQHDYSHQISCQIWQFDGALVGRSGGAPDEELSQGTGGFTNSTVKGEPWRVYTVVDAERGLRVMVGDRLWVRDRLVDDVRNGLALPALVVLPFLPAAIWAAVGRGLQPLLHLADFFEHLPADRLRPFPDTPAPREIRPVIASLNALIGRVTQQRNRERDFTTYAAHELKTPLAGLKTQAQVALIAPDTETRARALGALLTGVDRTDRMVRQLLDLSRLDSPDPESAQDQVDLRRLAADLRHDLGQAARTAKVHLQIEIPDTPPYLITDAEALRLALRNLVENAIDAAPAGSVVTLHVESTAEEVCFHVEDQGAGMTSAEIERAFERFYSAKTSAGSGLGLAIVRSAQARMGARLDLGSRQNGLGGLAALLTVPRGA